MELQNRQSQTNEALSFLYSVRDRQFLLCKISRKAMTDPILLADEKLLRLASFSECKLALHLGFNMEFISSAGTCIESYRNLGVGIRFDQFLVERRQFFFGLCVNAICILFTFSHIRMRCAHRQICTRFREAAKACTTDITWNSLSQQGDMHRIVP